MEFLVARDAGVTTTAKRDGVVTDVDATRIVVHADAEAEGIGGDVDIYIGRNSPFESEYLH